MNRQLNRFRAGRVVLLCVLTAGSVAGCKSTPPARSLKSALADYEAKRYRLAEHHAAAIARQTRGLMRDKAAYLAGLSAYQLGDLYEAQRQLATAVKSSDRTTAGRAKAVLGLVRVGQHRPHDAAVLLAEASGALTGENSRQAAYQAALAHQEAGDETSAGTWFRIAAAGQTTGQRALGINSGARAGRFSLQAGAFRRRQHADNAARRVADVAQQHGLGGIRVIESRDERGRSLYFVQFGRFESRSAASSARRLIGRLDVIVVPSIHPTS
ncbi:MAG: SPOR domain-containing protein [Phycisphaerales bacterium]